MNVFGIGKKYCYTCGTEVSGNQYTRFGKPFCSEEHAQQYTDQMNKSRQEQLATAQQTGQSGGCC